MFQPYLEPVEIRVILTDPQSHLPSWPKRNSTLVI